MVSRLEIPITTLANGTSIVVIVPMSCVFGQWVANGKYLPFVQNASGGSSDTPYQNAGSYITPGPFNSQLGNIMTYSVDAVTVDFM